MIVVNHIRDRSYTVHFVEESDRQALLTCLHRGINTWQDQMNEPGKVVNDFIAQISTPV
jgi:hypothetical protein